MSLRGLFTSCIHLDDDDELPIAADSDDDDNDPASNFRRSFCLIWSNPLESLRSLLVRACPSFVIW